MEKEKTISGLALLRMPFLPNQISKLPKPYNKDAPKGKCNECGGYHGLPAMHLDYVGHAALTDRLLDVDPQWHWEPLSYDEHGLPFIDKDGGMWIKLTILGVTRLGYGDCQGKKGANATKELIGDSLRNAAMRFGAALELWHKGILHLEEENEEEPKQAVQISTKESTNQFTDNQFEDNLIAIQEALDIDAIKLILKSCLKLNATDEYMSILKSAATKRKLELGE